MSVTPELQEARDYINKSREEYFERQKKEGTLSTGSKRYNKGKPDCHHIAPEFIIELAALMTESAKKYSDWNYALGQPFTVPYNSLMRHIHSFMNGEDLDSESGKSHLLHVAANALIMWTTQKYQLDNHPELDNRFKKTLGLK